MKKILIGITFAILSITVMMAQSSTAGKDFWVAWGKNYLGTRAFNSQIRIAAPKSTTVTLHFTELGTQRQFNLEAGDVYTYDLTAEEKNAVINATGGKTSKSLHITSTENISLFAILMQIRVTDATHVLPANALGSNYYLLSYKSSAQDGGTSDGYTVVAVEDNTNIYENEILQATLNKGEVYSQYFYRQDKTGIQVSSDKPIACFVTNECTEVPADRFSTGCDCLYEQMTDVSLWGRRFMVPTDTIKNIGRVRVLAATNNTHVSYNSGTIISGSTPLNAGEFLELEITTAGKGSYIEADKPIAVGAYLVTSLYAAPTNIGDPGLAWVPPVEQKIASVVIAPFFAAGESVLTTHGAIIMTETNRKLETTRKIATGTATPVSGTWVDNPAGYSYLNVPLTNNTSAYTFENPNGLTVLGYGMGNLESYYYLAAAAARKLDASFYINEIHYQDIDTLNLFCIDTLHFRADVTYPLSLSEGHLKWYIDGVEKTDVRDSINWTLTENDIPNYYSPHTYTLIITDYAEEVDTLQTTFGIVNTQIPLTVIPPTTEFYVGLQSAIPSEFANEVISTGFEYRKQGDTAWIPLEADAYFAATTPNLSNGKWEFRAILETSTECKTVYSEVKGLVIVCDCD